MSGTGFKDAEAFLADLGVERRPIVVRLPDAEPADDAVPALSTAPLGVDDAGPDETPAPSERPASDGTTVDVVTPQPAAASVVADPVVEQPADPDRAEAIGAALATVRRITAAAPASEGRLRRKLEERQVPSTIVDAVLARARAERLVDDDALAAALVAEWRAAGHGAVRLRRDLRTREFDEDTIVRALAVTDADDPMVVAFGLARARAEKMRHVAPDVAYRRIAEYVARRGHPEAIARKAARDAVYDDRERERTAGH